MQRNKRFLKPENRHWTDKKLEIIRQYKLVIDYSK